MIQALIALDHRSQVLKRYLNDDPAGQDVLAEVRGMTAEAIEDLRRIIRAMRPIYLEDFGLVPALEVLARDCSASGDADVHFEKEGMPHRLPPEQEMTLYRVAQEALNNARRHSDASKIWLKVRFEPEEVIVSIRDNGVGFRAPKQVTDLPRNGHFGLIGMFERAELAGANLRIDSAPGRGTTITIRTKAAEAL
jgi:signal transduction histidine kinase